MSDEDLNEVVNSKIETIKFTIDDTNKLLKHLEKNQIVEEGMVLADIYNIDTEVYKTSTKGNKIGF